MIGNWKAGVWVRKWESGVLFCRDISWVSQLLFFLLNSSHLICSFSKVASKVVLDYKVHCYYLQEGSVLFLASTAHVHICIKVRCSIVLCFYYNLANLIIISRTR